MYKTRARDVRNTCRIFLWEKSCFSFGYETEAELCLLYEPVSYTAHRMHHDWRHIQPTQPIIHEPKICAFVHFMKWRCFLTETGVRLCFIHLTGPIQMSGLCQYEYSLMVAHRRRAKVLRLCLMFSACIVCYVGWMHYIHSANVERMHWPLSRFSSTHRYIFIYLFIY